MVLTVNIIKTIRRGFSWSRQAGDQEGERGSYLLVCISALVQDSQLA